MHSHAVLLPRRLSVWRGCAFCAHRRCCDHTRRLPAMHHCCFTGTTTAGSAALLLPTHAALFIFQVFHFSNPDSQSLLAKTSGRPQFRYTLGRTLIIVGVRFGGVRHACMWVGDTVPLVLTPPSASFPIHSQ